MKKCPVKDCGKWCEDKGIAVHLRHAHGIVRGHQLPKEALVKKPYQIAKVVECPRCGRKMSPQGLAKHLPWHDRQQTAPAAPVTVYKMEHDTEPTPATWDVLEQMRIADEFALLRIDDPVTDTKELIKRAAAKALPDVRASRRAYVLSPSFALLLRKRYWELLERPAPQPAQVVEPTMTLTRVEGITSADLGKVAQAIHVTDATPLPVKPKITIFGANHKQQRSLLDAKIAEDFRMEFVESGHSLPATDWALCTQQAHPGVLRMAQTRLGRDKVFFVSGGVSSIIRSLVDIRDKARRVS